MAQKEDNTFTSWELTDEEVLQGNVLTETHKRVLQNKRANIARQKIELSFDPEHPQYFVQQEAYLKGKLELLNELFEEHDDAVKYFASIQQ